MIGLGREAWKPPAPGMGSADEKAVGASAGGAHSRQSSVNEKHGAHAHAHAHGGHSTPTGLPRARTRSTTSNSDRSSRASSRGGSPARSPTGRHLRNLSGDGTNSAPGPPPLGQTHSPLAPAWDATTSGSSKTPLATPSTPERRGRSMEASFEDSRRRRGRAPKQSDRRHSVQQVEEEKEAASRPAPASAAASTSDQTTMPDANMHAVLDTANDRASSMSTLREPESEAESSPASAPASAPEEGSSSASPIPPSSAAPLSSSSSSDKRASRDSEEWVQVGPDGRGKSKGGLSRSSLRRSGGRGSEIDAGGGGKDL